MSAGATSEDVRATWSPTHARRRAGSSSFQLHTLSMSGVKATYAPSSSRIDQFTTGSPATASHSDGRT